FVPDYDMSLARYLVSGCDLWLNNPLRPQEASGTSGMKAALNGAQSLSTLDGWWDEAFNRNIGWKIGAGADSDGSAEADTRDRDEIYDLLENEIIPLYYSRDADNVPSEWIGRALRSVSSVACGFSAQRMVRDYARRYYLPACSGSQATQPAG
ncbi:MAG: alpha-glucan family phosphorylase, partial [Candidatus Zixiibacteriota bacterium]